MEEFQSAKALCEATNGELVDAFFQGRETTACKVGDTKYILNGETIHVLAGGSHCSFPGPDDAKHFEGDTYSSDPHGGLEFEVGRSYHTNNY